MISIIQHPSNLEGTNEFWLSSYLGMQKIKYELISFEDIKNNLVLYEISCNGNIKKYHSKVLPTIPNNVIQQLVENKNFYLILGAATEGYNTDINLLEKFCNDKNISHHKVILLTGNCRHIDYYKTSIPVIYIPWFEKKSKNEAIQTLNVPFDLKRQYTWLSLNRIPRPHRVVHVSHLLNNNLADKFLWSLDNHPKGLKFIFESTKNAFNNELTKDIGVLRKHPLPKVLDIPDFNLFTSTNPNLYHLYKQAYFSVVTETSVANDTTFISEKTFKPIINGHPFIIIGNPKTLDTLHNWGYKTYHGLFNEAYDKIEDKNARIQFINNEIERISALSLDEIHELYNNVKDIIVYNQQRFFMEKTFKEDKIFLSSIGYTT
jgi:hypothetical protein